MRQMKERDLENLMFINVKRGRSALEPRYFRYCFARQKPFITIRPRRKFATVYMELPGLKGLDLAATKELRALIGPHMDSNFSMTILDVPMEHLLTLIVVLERIGQGAIHRNMSYNPVAIS